MKDQDTYLTRVGLKSLGFDPGPLDGDFGPKTLAALNAWKASLGLGIGIAQRLVEFARKEVGIRETSKNQGPGIEKYWSATSYPKGYQNREPYCAAAAAWLVKQACAGQAHSFSLPTTPLAYGFEKWAANNSGRGIAIVSRNAARSGDIFTLSAASHVGIIESVSGSTATTLEANTDGSGSREGDGFYRKTRNISGFRKVIRIV